MLVNTIGTIHGKKTRSLFLGKVKMWFIFFTIILGYATIFNYLNNIYALITLVLTIICEIIVIIDYIIFLLKQEKNTNRFKIKSFDDLIYFLFDTDYYKSTLVKK